MLPPPAGSAGKVGSRGGFEWREGGGVGGAQVRVAALLGRTERAEALLPVAQVAARVPGERAEAGLCRGQAELQGTTRVLGTILVRSSRSSGACFPGLDFRMRGGTGAPSRPPLACSGRLAPHPRSPCSAPPPAGAAGAETGRGTRQGGTWKNHPDCIAVGEAARRSRFP